jgi:hypothetical protein
MESIMKLCSPTLAGLAIAAMTAVIPAHKAVADTGTAVGVGAYLLGDYVVGRKCGKQTWPLNIVSGVVHTVQGKPFCRYYRRR